MGEAVKELLNRKIERKIVYFYVVDDQGRLQGVLSARKLLLSQSDEPIEAVMDRPVVSIHASKPLSEALELFHAHRLLALPVVDDDGRLIGAVDVELYAEEAPDLADRRRAHDIFEMIGVSVEQRRASAVGGFNMRMPWLLCNVAGGNRWPLRFLHLGIVA